MNSMPFRTDPSPVVPVDPAELRGPDQPATCNACGYLILEPRRHAGRSQTCARALTLMLKEQRWTMPAPDPNAKPTPAPGPDSEPEAYGRGGRRPQRTKARRRA